MQKHPGVQVYLEAAGSVASVRKITDLGRRADILASSDALIIDRFLVPDYADWNLSFATNEMVIAYQEKSRYKAAISRDNWMQILNQKDVSYGRSDPHSDPCGYRTLLLLQLAEAYYASPGLTENLTSSPRQHIRPKEVDLLALLETGTVDYIFIYRSVAAQHQLPYLLLPAEINLGDPQLAAHYAKYSVSIPGDKPGHFINIEGSPIVYSICLLRNAPNPILAKYFLDYLTDPVHGMQILEASGQKPFSGNLREQLHALLQ